MGGGEGGMKPPSHSSTADPVLGSMTELRPENDGDLQDATRR